MSIILDLFFSTARPFAFFLNVLILVLTAAATLRALRVLMAWMPTERAMLEKIRTVGEPTREAVTKAVAGSGTQVEARVQDLAMFHASKHTVDAASLTGLTTAAFRNQLAYADGIARSLVILGLLGTLWGLGSAVTYLAGTISGGPMTASALTSSILGTLGGLQTAFGTTLAGLFGALTAGLAIGLARGRQATVLREIERVMSTTLVPLFDTSEALSLTDAAKALEAMEKRVAEDMLVIISGLKTEGTELRKRLKEDFDRLETAFKNRAQQLVEATGRALESTLSIIGERAEGEPTLADYVRTVRTTVEDLQHSVDTASSLIPELKTEILSAIDSQRTGLQQVFSDHQQAMEPLLKQHSESINELAGAASRNAESSGTLSETLGRVAERLDAARTRWTELDEKIVEIGRSSQQGIENGLRTVVSEIAGGRQDESAARERIARHLATFETELRNHLDRLLEERNRVLAQMSELVEATREAVRVAVLQVGERLGEREEAQGRALTAAVETLGRELRGMVWPTGHRPATGPDGGRNHRERLAWDRIGPAPSTVGASITPESGD